MRDLDRSVQRPPASDVTLRMGSAGLRSELLQFGGFELALRGDAGIASLATRGRSHRVGWPRRHRATRARGRGSRLCARQRWRRHAEALLGHRRPVRRRRWPNGVRRGGGCGCSLPQRHGWLRGEGAHVGHARRGRLRGDRRQRHADDNPARRQWPAVLAGAALGRFCGRQELFWNQEEVFRTDSARSGHRRDRDKWGMAARLGYDFGLRRAKGAVSPFVEYDLNQRDRQETRFGIGYVAERAKRLQFDVSGARVSSPHGTEQRWLLTVQGRL